MSETLFSPSPEELALLSQVVRDITRSRRLSPEDAEDFAQTVQVRLVERSYDIFRRFSGRSSLRTYLAVVIKRMLLDWQNSMYGKWRPSIGAGRLGPLAFELERLIDRDQYSRDEAIEIVRMRHNIQERSDLQRLVDQLPPRRPHRTMTPMPEDARGADFEDPLAAHEQQRIQARIRATLATAVDSLSSDDRRLLMLRYRQHRSVQTVAETMQIDPKLLYRRFERVLRSLRRTMCAHGVTGPSMIDRGSLAGSPRS